MTRQVLFAAVAFCATIAGHVAALPLSAQMMKTTTGGGGAILKPAYRKGGSAAKVRIAFYTESLCPDCRNFTLGALATAFQNGISEVMEIDLVPYGNARRDKVRSSDDEGEVNPQLTVIQKSPHEQQKKHPRMNPITEYGSSHRLTRRVCGSCFVHQQVTGELTCQHGPLECTFNKVFGCASHLYPEQQQWFRFLHCMEEQKPLMMQSALEGCAGGAGMEAERVEGCANGALGARLEAEYEQQTGALVPAHTFVPWVTVNDVPLWMDVDNLEQYVCAAYGGERPAACFRSKE